MAHNKRALGMLGFIGVGALALGLAGCSSGDAEPGGEASGGSGELTTVGFVAVGPEGGWRNANEQAIKDAFTEDAGFELKYAPAASPSDQKSQLDAFSTFVNDEVDVILLTATEASGWEDSLKLAKEAEIPVILLDPVSTLPRTSTSPGSRPTTCRSRSRRRVGDHRVPGGRQLLRARGCPGSVGRQRAQRGLRRGARRQVRLEQGRRADRQLEDG